MSTLMDIEVEGTVSTTPSGSKTWLLTSNPFEKKFGYKRAVRKGPFIFVSGTTALKLQEEGEEAQAQNENDDRHSKVYFPKDARKQAEMVMQRCVGAVERLGGKRTDVVRVRMFVSKHEDCLEVGEAYRNCFATESFASSAGSGGMSDLGSTATMLVVPGGFVDPDILVEIEVDAVVD